MNKICTLLITIVGIIVIFFVSAPVCFAGVDTNILNTKGIKLGTIIVSTNYVMVSTNTVVLVDASGGNRIIMLPTAAGNTGVYYNIKKIDITNNLVTVSGVGGNTIDGALTQVLKHAYEGITLVSDGYSWYIL